VGAIEINWAVMPVGIFNQYIAWKVGLGSILPLAAVCCNSSNAQEADFAKCGEQPKTDFGIMAATVVPWSMRSGFF